MKLYLITLLTIYSSGQFINLETRPTLDKQLRTSCRKCLENYKNTFYCGHKFTGTGFCCTKADLPEITSTKDYAMKSAIGPNQLNCLNNKPIGHKCSNISQITDNSRFTVCETKGSGKEQCRIKNFELSTTGYVD